MSATAEQRRAGERLYMRWRQQASARGSAWESLTEEDRARWTKLAADLGASAEGA